MQYGDNVIGRRYVEWMCNVLKPFIDTQVYVWPCSSSCGAYIYIYVHEYTYVYIDI